MCDLLISIRTSLAILAILCVAVSQAQSADPVNAVPESASAVVRWKSPQVSLGKLADFVDAVQPGIGEIVRSGLAEFGNVNIPGLDGVDLEQDIWMIYFADPKQEAAVFLFTAKDVDVIKGTLETEATKVHTWDKLVAISDDSKALESVRRRLDGEGKSLWTTVDASSKSLFDGADISVQINVKQLNEKLPESWKAEGLDEFADVFREIMSLSETDKESGELFSGISQSVSKSARQTIRDAKYVTLGVTFTATTIRYENRLQVIEGSETAIFLAHQPATDLSLLTRLPMNKHAYLGVTGDMSGLTEWWMKMVKLFMPKLTTEQVATVDAAAREMADQKYEEMILYLDLNSKAPALRYGSVSVESPTHRSREINHKLLGALSEFRTSTGIRKQSLEPNAVKVGGTLADRITIIDVPDKPPDPDAAILNKALFGETENYLVMYQPKRVLQVQGGIGELLNVVTALDSPRKDSAMNAARLRLSDKANVVLLVDVARLIANGLKLATDAGLPIEQEALDGLNLEPSYLGFAISCESSAVRMQFEIPVLQVQNIKNIVTLLGGLAF